MTSHPTTQEIRTAIASDERAPAVARRLLDELPDRLSEPDLVEAKLLVSEVVTDAVLHGRTDQIDVVIDASHDELRVEVSSAGTGFPETHQPEPAHRTGWGALILERMAHAWGIDRDDDRTSVWFRRSLLSRR